MAEQPKRTWGTEATFAIAVLWGFVTYRLFWQIPADDIEVYTPAYNLITSVVVGGLVGNVGWKRLMETRRAE